MEDHAQYKHPSMLVNDMNTEDIRQEDNHNDHHRASIYENINHSRCLSSQQSTEYDGSARVSLHKGTSHAILPESHSSMPDPAASADQVRLPVRKNYLKVDKYKYPHVKLPIKSYKKQNFDDAPSSGNSHKTITTKDHLKMDNQ
jgi:hypothetical protein